jgi:hypothetical protein
MAGVAPHFPFEPKRFALYTSMRIPIRLSGRLTLLKDRTCSANTVSGWFAPSHFAVNIDLEFVAGLLMEPTDDPKELLDQRNRMALQVIDPVSRTNWRQLEMFIRHDVTVEFPPEFAREALRGVPMNECLRRYPSRKKPNWTDSQIELVAEAAEGVVRIEMAFELLEIVEKASESFIEAITSPLDGVSERTPRRDVLNLMTSDPDLALTRFMSAEMPLTYERIKFADIATAVPDGPGIYQIWHYGSDLLKVGIGTNLRKRLQKHRASRDSALKLKPGGTPGNPDDLVSKGSILAKHLYFDQGLVKKYDLTTEDGRRRFLEDECEITIYRTESKEKARELEKALEASGKVRYQGKVRVR